MTKRIFLFESDKAFGEMLAEGFAQYEAQVYFTDDGDVGVEQAESIEPHLIILAVELGSTNGFLVCKKIKKSEVLGQVPMIIVSNSSNADEIFEQHKTLRTHADDYIKKPITFEQMLPHIQKLIALKEEDEHIEEEVQAFTDQAFDALFDHNSSPSRVQQDAKNSHEVSGEQELEVEDVDLDAIELDDEVVIDEDEEDEDSGVMTQQVNADAWQETSHDSQVRSASFIHSDDESTLKAELRAMLEERNAWQARAEDLQKEFVRLQKDASEVSQLRIQVSELGEKAVKTSGVSTRDFLDLREALNAKDKELLDIRDQLTIRDKQMIELREQNLQHARLRADDEDKILLLERKVATAEEAASILQSDKESAAKRQEDLKNRLERSEQKVNKLEEDIEQLRAKAEKELEEAALQRASALTKMEEHHESQLTLLSSQLTEIEEKFNSKEQELGQVLAQVDDLNAKLDALQSKHEAALQKMLQDEELLARVRKALSIGMGLLEEQHASRKSEF